MCAGAGRHAHPYVLRAAVVDDFHKCFTYTQCKLSHGIMHAPTWHQQPATSHSHSLCNCTLPLTLRPSPGIDCSTQMLNQQFQEPFLAVVVDPVRTMASGKVEIGAFRWATARVKRVCKGTGEQLC